MRAIRLPQHGDWRRLKAFRCSTRAGPEVESLAEALIVNGALPIKAFVDAAHIAVCAVADIKILLTLNFEHIANGFMMKKIQSACTENGFDCPQLLTPLQLLGANYVD